MKRLKEIGDWLGKYGESIYETKGGPILNGAWGGTTWKDNKLYVHIIDWRKDEFILPKINANIIKIYSLTASEVITKEQEDRITLTVPDSDKQVIDTIIVVEFDKNVNDVFDGIDVTCFVQGKEFISDALIV